MGVRPFRPIHRETEAPCHALAPVVMAGTVGSPRPMSPDQVQTATVIVRLRHEPATSQYSEDLRG